MPNDFMSRLAAGLRGAGGVLSPNVYNTQARERLVELQQASEFERQKQLLEYKRKSDMEQNQAISNAVGPYLQKGDYEGAIKAVASVPGGVDIGLKLLDRVESRRDQMEQKKMQLQGMLASKMMQMQMQGLTMAQRAQIAADANAIRLQIAEMTNALGRQRNSIAAARLAWDKTKGSGGPSDKDLDKPRSGTELMNYTNDKGEYPPTASSWRYLQKHGFRLKKTLNADAAGRSAMMAQAYTDLQKYEQLVFGGVDEQGNPKGYNKGLVASTNIPGMAGVPMWTESREAYSLMENALAAKLRIETGAASNEGEIKNTSNRFKPGIGDTKGSAWQKTTRMKDVMKMGLDGMYQAGLISGETYNKARASRAARGDTNFSEPLFNPYDPQQRQPQQQQQQGGGGGKVVNFEDLP